MTERRRDERLVTVVVPLHEGAGTIRTTLDSLAAQSRADLVEVVVVDDGSTDDGPRIARDHPVVDRVLTQPRRGVAAARNRGSLDARGEWLAYLDQDDLWQTNRAERLAPVLRTSASSFVLTGESSFAAEEDRARLARDPAALQMVDRWVAAGRELDELCRASTSSQDPPRVVGHHTLAEVQASTLSTTTSFFVRREHLWLAGGWSLHARSIDDWWLMASCARLEPIARVDERSHLYRIHPAATSRATNFWYAYASSLVALKYGGTQDTWDATARWDNRIAEHLYLTMLRSDEIADRPGAREFTRHAASLIWPDRPVRRELLRQRVKRAASRTARLRGRSGATG